MKIFVRGSVTLLASRAPPVTVIGPPSDLTTSPGCTVRVPSLTVSEPSSTYPRAPVAALTIGVCHDRSLLAVPWKAMTSRALPDPTFPRTLRVKSATTPFR